MRKVILCGVAALLLVCAPTMHLRAESPRKFLSMSLEDCLDFAKENSIVLQQAKLQTDSQEAQQVIAKGAFMPTISGSVSQNIKSNPLSERSSKSSYTGSYGVDLSMTLYKGGANRASLQKSGLGIEIANLEYDEYKNSLDVAITEVFVEILYSIESIEVQKSTIELQLKNEERGAMMLELGSINDADFAQLQSATASSQYDLVVAQTRLSNLYVAMKNLLEITQSEEFTIKELNIPNEGLVSVLPTVGQVYGEAMESRPEVNASKLNVESAQLDETIAHANFLPTVSLSAGTGVNHNSSSNYTFSGQLRENFSTSAGVHLSVPIFNGFRTRSSVRIAKNTTKSAELTLSDTQKNLYQTIETLHNNASTSQSKFVVSQYLLTATEKSLALTTEQYAQGMKSVIELLTEQNNYTQAYQDLLMNKYQLILNKALLNFYKTNIIKL